MHPGLVKTLRSAKVAGSITGRLMMLGDPSFLVQPHTVPAWQAHTVA